MLQDLIVRRTGVGQIEVNRLLSLGHIEISDPFQKGQGSISVHGIFGLLDRAVFDVVLRKKLLRAFAAGSARAVVPPLQSECHTVTLPLTTGSRKAGPTISSSTTHTPALPYLPLSSPTGIFSLRRVQVPGVTQEIGETHGQLLPGNRCRDG